MTWDEMIIELRKEYPDVIGKAKRIAEQLDGHISKLDAYAVLSDYYHHRTEAQHEALREALSKVPAIDVVPVMHGRWIYTGVRGRFPVCECSVCGNKENADWAILGDNVNYCPNCGARMDEETDDD